MSWEAVATAKSAKESEAFCSGGSITKENSGFTEREAGLVGGFGEIACGDGVTGKGTVEKTFDQGKIHECLLIRGQVGRSPDRVITQK